MPSKRAAARTGGDEAAARRALVSLLGKSAKARRKLAPGTWQRTMLDGNVRALRLALALLRRTRRSAAPIDPAALRDAQRAVASMLTRTAKAKASFPPGTSPHTLQRNRQRALRLARARIRLELERHRASG